MRLKEGYKTQQSTVNMTLRKPDWDQSGWKHRAESRWLWSQGGAGGVGGEGRTEAFAA